MDPFDFHWKMMAGMRRVKDHSERAIHPFCEQQGLTPVQLRLLITLFYDGPQTMRTLSAGTCMAMANSSVQCKRLEKLGYLTRQRDAQDERQVLVSLTGEGARLVEELKFSCMPALDAMSENISEQDADNILASLDKLATIFEEENAS